MWYNPSVCTKEGPFRQNHQCNLRLAHAFPSNKPPTLNTSAMYNASFTRSTPSSPKLHSTDTSSILHMLQIQLLILLTLRMEINPTNTSINLIKANVIKTLETRARDRLHAVVRHEEVFFPAHENVFALLVVFERERRRFGGFGQRAPGREACPVLEVDFLRGTPGRVCGFEEVFGADNFAFKECG